MYKQQRSKSAADRSGSNLTKGFGRFRDGVPIESLELRTMLSVNVLTYHGDLASTGVNSAETQLTPANVNTASFGKLYSTTLDGQVYAEPLVYSSVTIASGPNTTAGAAGVHNVVFAATEHDTLYAIDASPGGGQILWQRSFLTTSVAANNTLGATAITTVPSADVSNSDISPEIGITGTPVIDASTNTLYVVVKTKETIGGVAHYVQRLHAINISDGTDRVTPFLIGDTTNGNTNNTPIYCYGTGDGAVTDPYNGTGKQVVQFNALHEAERQALSLVNGTLYVSWASHGDTGPYHGWVVAWNVSNLATSGFKLAGVLNTSPNGGLAGVWGGGGKLTFESDGSAFYFETGNGPTGHGNPTLNASGFPVDGDYYEALIKVVADPTTTATNQNMNGWGFKVADYFIPYNQVALDNADLDFGSSSPVILPDSAGIPGHPHLLIASGKEGKIYLIDRDNMGKFNATNDQVLDAAPNGSGNNTPPVQVSGTLSSPAYFNGTIYYASGYNGPAGAYHINSDGTITETSQTSESSLGYLPGSVVVSANGTTNGIVWVMDRNLNEIHAYDANSLATELWNSGQVSTDSIGAVIKFAVPTIANGEVYVGGTNVLNVFGLRQAPTAVPNAPVLTASPLSGTAVNLTWTDSSVSPNQAGAYLIEESTDGTNYTQVATAPATSRFLAIGGLTLNTKYYFRIRGQDGVGDSSYSSPVTVTTTNIPAFVLDGSFESTKTSSFIVDPTTANWTFTGRVGIEANGSAWGAAAAPDGTQAAFLQATATQGGSISQTVTFALSGGYQLNFQAAQRAGYGIEPISVAVDGTVIATITPGSTSFQAYSTPTFNVTAGSHVITFATAQFNTAGSDSDSFIDSVSLAAISVATTPNAPTALGAVPATATSITLAWTNNAPNETGYHLDRATDAGFTQNLITQTLPATPATFTDSAVGLAPGSTYYYCLRAFNTAGDSANSNVAAVTIPLAPPKPSNPIVTNVTTSEIDLSWIDNASTTAHAYLILRQVNGGIFTQYFTLPATSDVPGKNYTWTDTGVTPGTSYEYHVEDVNTSGNNDFIGFNAETITTPPTGLTASAGSGGISLSWAAPTGALQYNVYRGTAPGAEGTTPLATAIAGTTYTDTTATAGIKYYYTVTAVNSNINHVPALPYESAASNEVSATGAGSSTPAVNFPNGFTGATGLQLNGSVAISGSALQLTNGGSYQAASAFTSAAVSVAKFTSSFDFQLSAGASIGHGFTFTIQGQGPTALGQSGGGLGYGNDYETGAAVITKSVAVKFDLYSNEGEGSDSTGLFVNGANPTINASNSDLTPSGIDLHSGDKFNVQMSYDGTTLTVTIKDTVTGKSATQSYAVNIAGTVGSSSAYVGFTAGTGGLTSTQSILDWTFSSAGSVTVQPPSAPTGLVATASGTSVSLGWAESSTGLTGYHLDRATDAGFTQNLVTQTLAASATSFTDAGLTAGTTYYYRLRAVNSAGDSGNSNTASVTLAASVPAAQFADPSFEAISVGTSYAYDPSSPNWSFTGLAGVEANGSAWGAANAPDGKQAAFLQANSSVGGSISQTLNITTAGSYQISFAAAQRAGYGLEPVLVAVDGTAAVTISPGSTSFQSYTTPVINLSVGKHVISFVTASIVPADSDSFIDNVKLVPVTSGSTPAVNFPNGFTGATGLQLNGSAAISGSALQLTNGGSYQAASAFTSTAVSVAKFTTSFDFQLSAGANIGHGFTFTLQGQGPTALGQSGGGLGYGNDYETGAAVITKSVAVKFDLYSNEGEGSDSTGLFVNGANPTINASNSDLTPSGIDLHSGDKFNVQMSYDGTTLTVTIKDTVTGKSATQSYAINIAGTVGSSSAYVGFTAGTGGLTSTQSILDWTFSNT